MKVRAPSAYADRVTRLDIGIPIVSCLRFWILLQAFERCFRNRIILKIQAATVFGYTSPVSRYILGLCQLGTILILYAALL